MAITRIINSLVRKKYFILFRTTKCSDICASNYINLYQVRLASQNQLTQSKQKTDSQVSTDFKTAVKENTKSVWYLGVIIAGIGVTGIMFYTIFRELFSSNSINGIYSSAVQRLEKENKIRDELGEPIKAFGEETRRRRRGHVAHSIFFDEKGKKHVRMQFYVKGSRQSGTVHLEVKENDSGNYEYRYFYVQLNNYSHSLILIEDNRLTDVPKTPETSFI